MPEDFAKVSKGQTWAPPTATTYNAMVDAAVAYRQGVAGGKGDRTRTLPRNVAVCLVKNTSGQTWKRYSAVAVVAPVTLPADSDQNEVEFKNNATLKADLPTGGDAGRWLVTLEDLSDGQIGLAATTGAVQCKINLVNTEHLYVDVEAGSTTPKSGPKGYRLLWVKGGVATASATGVQWAIVGLSMPSPDPLGQIQHQLHGMLTQNGDGYGLPLAVPDLTEVA